MILPDNHCYYHTHEIPLWVDLLYMNEGSNGHPEWTLFHIVLLISLSGYLTFMINWKSDTPQPLSKGELFG